jgi:isoleucyl-tRNA synthetase
MPDEFSQTLHLPSTTFAMRANLGTNEPLTYAHWDETDLYGKIRTSRQSHPLYILHDGPPYANGDVHLGTALNKILKDFVVRLRTMEGFNAPYVPGWDCHGLPIEHKVASELPDGGHSTDPAEVRKLCREYAFRYVDVQREQFRRLGVIGDWFNPYLTLHHSYEEQVIAALGTILERGYLYRGKKPVHWCTKCLTALAEAEVEYKDLTSPSIYVRFAVVPQKAGALGKFLGEKPLNLIIWTTTPWTLPANLAVAVHPDYEYSVMPLGDETIVVAEELWRTVADDTGLDANLEPLGKLKGRELEGILAQHPFIDRQVPVVLADYVTLEAGTGLVHTAPGHGAEDYMTGQRYGLPTLAPVDIQGRFTEEATIFAGEQVFEADQKIVAMLNEKGKLLWGGKNLHSYPHCWRCKSPVIFRATDQWFVDIEHNNLREEALQATDRIEWVPEGSRERMRGMLLTRPDWCISRQRAWGVPIPALHCAKCDEAYMTPESVAIFRQLVTTEGSDSWFLHPISDLLPAGAKCAKCGSAEFRKGTDILDVWFESGCSHLGVLTTREGLRWPADMYLEGSDQHRGWFQLSLLVSLMVKGSEMSHSIVTHGFTLDAEGHAMHKSAGNAVDPQDLVRQYGADVLRLWIASIDYHQDIPFDFETMDRVAEAYRRIRNTFRFMLGSIEGATMPAEPTNPQDFHLLDRWILGRFAELTRKVQKAYDEYEFHVIYHAIHNFCTVDLSAIYLDTAKDRLYTYAESDPDRRSAVRTLGMLTSGMARLLAPILVHTAEEVWQRLPQSLRSEESIHLAEFPQPGTEWDDERLQADFDELLEWREWIYQAIELVRAGKTIGHSLDASITMTAPEKELAVLRKYENILRTFLIVSEVKLAEGANKEVVVLPHAGEKCPRCWIHYSKLGTDPAHPKVCERCANALTLEGK